MKRSVTIVAALALAFPVFAKRPVQKTIDHGDHLHKQDMKCLQRCIDRRSSCQTHCQDSQCMSRCAQKQDSCSFYCKT